MYVVFLNKDIRWQKDEIRKNEFILYQKYRFRTLENVPYSRRRVGHDHVYKDGHISSYVAKSGPFSFIYLSRSSLWHRSCSFKMDKHFSEPVISTYLSPFGLFWARRNSSGLETNICVFWARKMKRARLSIVLSLQ
jgi:hypothetical protein